MRRHTIPGHSWTFLDIPGQCKVYIREGREVAIDAAIYGTYHEVSIVPLHIPHHNTTSSGGDDALVLPYPRDPSSRE
jgi:hypothetical protein